MEQKQIYSESLREQALKKVYSRGKRSVAEVAEELNINHWTLKNWMKANRNPTPGHKPDKRRRPQCQRQGAGLISDLILYASEDGRVRLNLRAEAGSVWLAQADIAELFQTSKQNVSLHTKIVLQTTN